MPPTRSPSGPLISDSTEIPLLRIGLSGDSPTGLAAPSSIMVDKLTTMPRSELGQYIGASSSTNMLALSRALVVFLGLA
jgi:mRNA interferase MazF